jgi:ribosomal protein S4E
MTEEKVKAVEAEDQRLQDAKVIREVKYPVWLANTVPVKKKNEKWRMCVDFTDLNKACKKEDFPLVRVDKIMDDAANSEIHVLGTSSNQSSQRRRRKNKLHHSLRNVLFRENA